MLVIGTIGLVNAQICGPGTVVINEIDPDQAGTDAAEFVELYSSTPNCLLDGLVLVLYNGSDDQSYDAIDLDGAMTDANGLYVINFPSNGLQNGADAVALIMGDAVNYPTDTPIPAAGVVVDVIVYGTNDANDTGLLTGFGETIQYDDESDTSIGRNPDGSETIVEDLTPSAGALNAAGVPGVSITISAPDGTDNQTVAPGGTATFVVVVTNTGTVDLESVETFDVLAPNCDQFIGDLLVGQMTSYTCTATNITSDFVNTIGVAAETAAGDELEEEDMTNVVVMLPCPTIMVATSGIDVTCNGAADGSAMAIPSGGAEPYTFLWSNGAITSDISNLDTGNYVVIACLLYTSPSPRDLSTSRMPSSA